MTDLKLCPFCGGEAETLTAESMHGGYLFGIMCNDCRSRGDVYDTEAEAIAAWNARAERTCMPTESGKCLHGTDCPAWLCSECGELFEQGTNFCSNCGAKVIE